MTLGSFLEDRLEIEEQFLLDNRVPNFIKIEKQEVPDKHLWIYTEGVLTNMSNFTAYLSDEAIDKHLSLRTLAHFKNIDSLLTKARDIAEDRRLLMDDKKPLSRHIKSERELYLGHAMRILLDNTYQDQLQHVLDEAHVLYAENKDFLKMLDYVVFVSDYKLGSKSELTH